MDEYSRWIPMPLDAPETDSLSALTKLIYEEDLTRWHSPVHIRRCMIMLSVHVATITDPKEVWSDNETCLDVHKDIIASMSYRGDHICTRNVDSLDFLPVFVQHKTCKKGSWQLKEEWTARENDILVDNFVTAHTDAAAVVKYTSQEHKTTKSTAMVGSSPQPQAVDALSEMSLEKRPSGYLYG